MAFLHAVPALRGTANGPGTIGFHLSALYSPIGWP
jgi:hypothetical protein